MKTAMILGLAIGLGVATVGWAFDQDALNSKKALATYGPKAEKIVSKADAAPAKATVAVTHDRKIGSADRDLGKADRSSQNSKKALTSY